VIKKTTLTVCGTALFALAASLAGAEPPRGGPSGPHPRPGFHYDVHYGHNNYYPARGIAVRTLPTGYVSVTRSNQRYFYSGGIWYAARGPGFVVVGPPFGVFVPVLPPFYTTLWIGGFPYYYANDTYYEWNDAEQGYEVVAPPEGAEVSDPGAPPPSSADAPPPSPGGAPGGDVFVYPRNGQSEEQTANDKYECHRWAVSQSGFDPTVSGGGVAYGDNGAKRSDYRRALGACLEGRGYSVK
jgi:hypothetical protein